MIRNVAHPTRPRYWEHKRRTDLASVSWLRLIGRLLLTYLPVDQGHRGTAQVSGADRSRRSQNHRRHWHRCTSGWDLPAVLTLTLVVERPWQPHHAGQIVRSAFATYNDAGIRRPGTVSGCPGSVPATALGDHQLLSIQHVGSYDSGLCSGPIQSGG